MYRPAWKRLKRPLATRTSRRSGRRIVGRIAASVACKHAAKLGLGANKQAFHRRNVMSLRRPTPFVGAEHAKIRRWSACADHDGWLEGS